jgi:hypothetical protein
LQKIEANTIQISKTAARPLRGSKLFYLFLMTEARVRLADVAEGMKGVTQNRSRQASAIF